MPEIGIAEKTTPGVELSITQPTKNIKSKTTFRLRWKRNGNLYLNDKACKFYAPNEVLASAKFGPPTHPSTPFAILIAPRP